MGEQQYLNPAVARQLLCSRPALRHLLSGTPRPGEDPLYPCDSPVIAREYLETRLRAPPEVGLGAPRSAPAVWTRDLKQGLDTLFDEQTGLSPEMLWQQLRRKIAERLSSERSGGFDAETHRIRRSFDLTFFTMHRRAPNLLPTEGDAHVHCGGAVPWEATWCALMTGRLPARFYARVNWIQLEGRHVPKLIAVAKRLRRELHALADVPIERARDPAGDALVFDILEVRQQLGDLRVRDYVAIRSAFRYEMVVGHVDSLDEYTKEAWHRLWGKKGRYSLAQAKRASLIGDWKAVVAIKSLLAAGVSTASLRANLTTERRRTAIEDARSVLRAIEGAGEQGAGFGIVVHQVKPAKHLTGKQRDEHVKSVERAFQWIDQKFAGPGRPPEWLPRDMVASERNVDCTTWKRYCELLAQAKCATNHCGEDFYDPWQALYRVRQWLRAAEAEEEFWCNPRIGHGSILGIPYFSLDRETISAPHWALEDAVVSRNALAADTEAPSGVSEDDQTLNAWQIPQDDVVSWTIDKEAQEEFYKQQEAVSNKARAKGAMVESMPTSNVCVLRLRGYQWAPFWGLVAQGLTVLLGTDNPGFGDAWIEDEYARLGGAFERRLKLEDEDSFPEHLKIGDRRWTDIQERVRADTREHALVGRAPPPAILRSFSRSARRAQTR